LATVIKGTGAASFSNLYNNMQAVEDQIGEGDWVELVFEFNTSSLFFSSAVINTEASALNTAMNAQGIPTWPGQNSHTFVEQNGKILKVRWIKGFMWLLIVIPLIFAALVAGLVYLAFWELNKFSPVVQGATSQIGLYLAIGAFLLVIFPAIFLANPPGR